MTATAREDAFFIGWLPVPRSYRIVQWAVGVFALQVAVGTALLVAAQQRTPGPGTWADDSQSVEGIVYASPYAMIRIPGEPVRTILLVGEGKFGAAERLRPFDGKPVRITGTVLQRDGRQMMELNEGDDAIQTLAMRDELRDLRRAQPIDLGEVTLSGEIVDSKCYLGAMKPGDGKTHKGCAALCLRGGVPPMFVTRASHGGPQYYLLIETQGGPVGEAVVHVVGEHVTITGRVQQLDDLQVLSIDPANIRRR